MALNYVVLDLDNGETMTSSHFIACLKMIAECNVAGRKDEGMPSIIFTKCDKESIKRNLIRVSDNNEYNIIIVCSDKTLNNIKEAIKEIVDNSISNKLNELISRLQGEPPFTHFKDFICGIRKRTFIFSACSNSNNVHHIVYCKYKILQIMNWIYKQEEATMIEAKDNKSNISSADASIHTCAPSCSKFVEETERTSMEIEIPKKLRSSIMFSVDIALNIMRNVIREDEVRTADVKLSDSHCRILAEDLYSSTNVPSRRTSAKYGYAVLASDGKGVRKVLPSSSPETSVLTPGTCMRIRSGAPIPVGATAVVKLENTRVTEKYKNNDHSDYFNRDNKEYEIEVLTVPEINENIRDAGYHIKSNQLVLEKYSYIGPIEMGILDLCNFKTLPMTAELLVGLLSIGDELNELEKLYESSSKIILRSLLEKNYYVTDYKISSYELEVMVEKLQKALKKM